MADKKLDPTDDNPRFIGESGSVAVKLKDKRYAWTWELSSEELADVIDYSICNASNDDGVRAHAKAIAAYIRSILAPRE
jgi:hypothetical protein